MGLLSGIQIKSLREPQAMSETQGPTEKILTNLSTFSSKG